MEEHLLNADFTTAIVACFNTPKINAFDPNLLEPLLKVLRLSPCLAASLAKSEMYSGIAQKLTHKKAVVRLNLLRLVRNVLDARETDYFSSSKDAQLRTLLRGIQALAEKDSAVLVRNLASELVKSHIEGASDHHGIPSLSSSVSTSASSSRSRSSARRIYTPPSLQHASASTPMTPTQASASSSPRRPSLYTSSSAVAGGAFVEVASSPKRSSAALARERDNFGIIPYRPRSKDGGLGLYRPGSRESITTSSSGIPVSAAAGTGNNNNPSLPRRGSADTPLSSAYSNHGSGGSSDGRARSKVRLSRTALAASRPSLSGLSSYQTRSESLLSSKENVASVAERQISPTTTTTTSTASPTTPQHHYQSGGLVSSPLGDARRGSRESLAAPVTPRHQRERERERRRSRAPSETRSSRKWST